MDSLNLVYPEFYSELLLAVIVFVGAFFMLTEQRRKQRQKQRQQIRRTRRSRAA